METTKAVSFLKEKYLLWDWHWTFPCMPHKSWQVKPLESRFIYPPWVCVNCVVATKGKLSDPEKSLSPTLSERYLIFSSFLFPSKFALSSFLSSPYLCIWRDCVNRLKAVSHLPLLQNGKTLPTSVLLWKFNELIHVRCLEHAWHKTDAQQILSHYYHYFIFCGNSISFTNCCAIWKWLLWLRILLVEIVQAQEFRLKLFFRFMF